MIYGRKLQVCTAPPGVAPSPDTLKLVRSHMYADKTIFARRAYDAIQAGYQLDRLLEIPGWYDYTATEYVRLGDSQLYRLMQAERRWDDNGIPCMWLSLSLVARTWADSVTLLSYPESVALNGYALPDAEPMERVVTCSIVSGPDGQDSYTGDKSRLRAQASVEIYASDYRRERFAKFRGQLYSIESADLTERYTQRLELLEVIR